jgi:tRNA pseudouridine38-40 synthase
VWWVKEPLDTAAMRQAAQAFVGMRDFRAFTAADGGDHHDERAASTRVLVDGVAVVDDGDLILVSVQGSHFLWKMVRRIVGVLVEIGRGGLPPAAAGTLLAGGSEAPAKLTAPPSGLFLERVFYKGDATGAPVRAATPLAPLQAAASGDDSR